MVDVCVRRSLEHARNGLEGLRGESSTQQTQIVGLLKACKRCEMRDERESSRVAKKTDTIVKEISNIFLSSPSEITFIYFVSR